MNVITRHILMSTAAALAFTSNVSAQHPAPVTPPGARLMQLWTDHPASPSGVPHIDYARLQELNRQAQLDALRQKVEAERQRAAIERQRQEAEALRRAEANTEQARRERERRAQLEEQFKKQMDAIERQNRFQQELARQQAAERRMREAQMKTIRPDYSTPQERLLWQQNQHLFYHGHGH